MYLNQLQYNQDELSIFYSLVRIMALSENINSIDLVQQNETTRSLLKFSSYQLRIMGRDMQNSFKEMRTEFNSLFEPNFIDKVKNIFTSDEDNKEEHEEIHLDLSQSEINQTLIHFYKNILTNQEYKNLVI